ncbi:MAG: choice-of-anchor tandem repeat NxxGxxAF-containing protein [Cyanobacteria bacterium J06573_11]
MTATSAQVFTFTEIARTNDADFSAFGETALNDLGQVAFSADVAGENGIFVGAGGMVSPLIAPSAGFSIDSLDFNNVGEIVFSQGSVPGVFKTSGGVTTSVITGASSLGDVGFAAEAFFFPKINDAGAIAFEAVNFGGDSDQGLYLVEGGAISVIAESPDFDIFRFDLNNNNQVAFASLSSLAPDGDGIFISEGGAAPTVLPDPLGFGTVEGPTLNDSGTVAFDVLFNNAEGDPVQGIFTQNGESLELIVDDSGELMGLGRPAVNNKGAVAFTAGFDAGGSALFSATASSMTRVIGTGDRLFGQLVTSAGLTQQTGLNNEGQIVFTASFADGSQGIFRADPEGSPVQSVPEPTSLIGLLAVSVAMFSRLKRS